MSNHPLAIWRPDARRARVARPGLDLFQLEPLERRYHLSAAQIDPTFGENGHLYFPGPAGLAKWGTSIAVQPDGAILLVGNAYEPDRPSRGASVLYRLLPDGSADSNFHPPDMPNSWFRRILPQADGKIVLMTDDELIRLNSDGQVDPTFNFRPAAPFPGEDSHHWFDDAALLLDGRIVAAVACDRGVETIVKVERFNSDGSPDLSFGQGGAVAAVPAGTDIYAVRPTPDGHLLLLTTKLGGGDNGLWRLNADGSVDPTFGRGGRAVIPELPWAANPELIPQNPLIVQPDGTIIVGVTEIQHFSDYELWLDDLARFTPDGRLDTTFGDAGLLALPYEPQSIDMLLHDGGTIDVVLKYYEELGTPGANRAIGLFRLNADATPDTTFGPEGTFRIDGSTLGDAQVALQGDKIIVLVNDTDLNPDHLDPARFFHMVRVGDAPARSVDDQADFATPQSAGDARPAWSQTPIFDDGQDELDWDSIHQVWS